MIKAVIFDLDGVIVSTDECHYKAWKKMADEEGIYFDKTINNRLRGVSRMESLEGLLEKAEKEYTESEKNEMAERKNNYYREYIKSLTPDDILPGVMDFCTMLRENGILVRHFTKEAIKEYNRITIGTLEDMKALADIGIGRFNLLCQCRITSHLGVQIRIGFYECFSIQFGVLKDLQQ